MDNVTVDMHLGEGAGGIKCTAVRGSGGHAFGRGGVDTGVAGMMGTSWMFDPQTKVSNLFDATTFCTARPVLPMPML